ncbi:MAG: hypothetical protein INR71_03045 [Terriglobus roseus]|nr:hypothetical protein [Terriglobus roseus]
MANSPPTDHVQRGLDYVNHRLAHPSFLKSISPSRLPSQAASEESSPPKSAHFLRPGFSAARAAGKPGAAVEPVRNDSLIPDGEVAATLQELGVAKDDGLRELTLDRVDGQHHHLGRLNGSPAALSEDIRNWRSFFHHFDFARLARVVTRARDTSRAHTMAGIATAAATAAPSGPGQASSFQTFDHGHHDLVLAVDFDFYGTRMVTASSDHRLKLWEKQDDAWTAVDTWRAHDAEIVDVKFNGPFTTPSLASVAEDARLKLWAEDPLATRNSGHRFRLMFQLRSETGVPFCSLAFKPLLAETYLAAVTRDGYLAVYEPMDFDDLASDWGRIDARHLCPTPDRSIETGFRVAWHQECLPCWTAVEAGLERKSLGLAVAAMDVVKVFRTDKDKRFYLAAELTGARGIIRDVAWANGAMRGYDLIAAASKDGLVRIYELSTPKKRQRTSSDLGAAHPASSIGASTSSHSIPAILEPDDASQANNSNSNGDGNNSSSTISKSPSRLSSGRGAAASSSTTRSAISSGLARSSATTLSDAGPDAGAPSSSTTLSPLVRPPEAEADAGEGAGRVRHAARCVAELGREHGGVWRVAWSFGGDVLMTTGDDGAVRAWKRDGAGTWREAARVDVEGG